MITNSRLALISTLLALSACGQASQELGTNIEPPQNERDSNRLFLPAVLTEVSGLTEAADGGLLLHNDEFGLVYYLTYSTGAIRPFASLGNPPVQADFEGITTLNDQLYLMTSKGTLYSRKTAADLSVTDYEKHKTGLKKSCEFEGLDSLPEANLLVLACKKPKKKSDAGKLILYFWSPETRQIVEEATLQVELDGALTEVHPSAIQWQKDRNRFVVLAAKERLILSLSDAGVLLNYNKLPESHNHPQAEGLAISKDAVYIADESVEGQPAQLSRYTLEQIDGLLSGVAN